jgi:hypothetical protein
MVALSWYVIEMCLCKSVVSFIVCSHPQISLGRSNKENEVGGARGTRGRGKFTWFWWESQKERDHSEDQGVGGRMGSEWTLGRLAGGV